MYVFPATRVQAPAYTRRLSGFRGLGITPTGVPGSIAIANPRTPTNPGSASRTWGVVAARPGGVSNPVAQPIQPVCQGGRCGSTATFTPPGTTQSTAAQVAGTPVPVGYSTNSVYINSDGSQWEYSASQGMWINVGTPYNLNAPGATTPGTTSSTASTGAQVAGTPVPVGYPTTSAYSDIYGNVWQFNASSGMWVETQLASANSTVLASGAGVVPAGTPDNAPYTDASGNTWVYNTSTGQWVESALASTDSYSSILTWLSQATLISPVPNWAVAAALGFIALKFMQPSAAKR